MTSRHPRAAGALASLLVLVLAGTACERGGAGFPEPELDQGVDVLRAIEYSRPGGVPLAMDIYLPEGDGPFAAVEAIHGGGFVGGSRGDMRGICLYLANAGYVAFSIDYRLAPGATYPAQVQDAAAAIAFVRENAERLSIDPARIAVLGSSAGATIGATLAGSGGDVAAVVSWSGALDLPALVSNGPAIAEIRIERYVGADDVTDPDALPLLEEASPIAHIGSGYPPMFVANSRSELMPFEQAVAMIDTLEAHGIDHVLFVPAGGHGIQYAREASAPTVRFLDTFLRS